MDTVVPGVSAELAVPITIPDDGNVALEFLPVPPFVVPSSPVTWVARLTTVVAAMPASPRHVAAIRSRRFTS